MNLGDFMEHPEGGQFQEVFRSNVVVTTDTGLRRSALTHIHYSLEEGEVSRFHRFKSDEVWNLYKGAGIRIHTWSDNASPPVCTELSAHVNVFCHVVPAGTWQAAEPISGAVLVGCSVGPGFDFADFEIIEPESERARLIQSFDPTLGRFIVRPRNTAAR